MPRLLSSMFALLSFVASALPAQVERYELGLRLRAFERHLAAVDDDVLRNAAFVELDRAVQAFFRLDTSAVARAIDLADCALMGPNVGLLPARSLQLEFDARLVAGGEGELTGELSVAYRIDGEVPEPDGWLLSLLVPGMSKPVTMPVAELPMSVRLPLLSVPSGDHEVTWSIARGDEVLVTRHQALSVVRDLGERYRRVATAAAGAKAVAVPTIESTTLPALCTMLRVMQGRRPAETILPGDRLLAEAEALAAWLAAPTDEPFYAANRPGTFWLRVPVGKRTAAVRLFVPVDIDADRPLVVALHGAGGSENLFFDGYGDGLAVKLAAERGWFVVAPRGTLGGVDDAELVDALAERFPIDRRRVVMAGHSMGAMQAVANAMRGPDRLAAVAALGGGGSVSARADLADLPFFVGVGERDFARRGAEALQRALEAKGAASTWHEYPGVEHLAIVQVALPDVFRFFDEVLRQR